MKKTMLSVALTSGVIATSALVPGIAAAQLTGSIGVANMYLWRGTNQTPEGGQVWGELKYAHESGAFAALWTTPDSVEGHETDLYFGYNTKIQGIGLGITFWEIMYPEAKVANTDPAKASFVDLGDTDVQELQLTASYGPIGINYYLGLDVPVDGSGSTPSGSDENNYLAIDATFGEFKATYGMWDNESDAADDYSHLTLMYMPKPELSFGVNFTMSDKNSANGDPITEEGPLFYAGYTWSFDLSKK